jgi:hypothetical protein
MKNLPTGSTVGRVTVLSEDDRAVLRRNSMAVEDLLTTSAIGSRWPSPIEYRCFEKKDATVGVR